MKIGATYPQNELANDPASLGRFGRAVEDLGYDHLLIYDHVVGAAPEKRDPPLPTYVTDKDPFIDPFVAYGYLAAVTQRIELVTGVVILPQRQTVLVAKQAADVDRLSGGRLRLGVGSGWNYVEYEALGQDFATRGARLTEQIDYLRRLWSEPLLSFVGQFDRIDRASILPRPNRQIPIWCGGSIEPAFRRAARQADGFFFLGAVEPAIASWQRVQALLREAGRPVAAFGAEYLIDNSAAGFGVEETIDTARRWQDAGGTHVTVVSGGLGFRTTEEHIAYIAEVRQRFGGR
jgi:probable F420-dependent oxidoreductase